MDIKSTPPLQKTLVQKPGMFAKDEEANQVILPLVLKAEHGCERALKRFTHLPPNFSSAP